MIVFFNKIIHFFIKTAQVNTFDCETCCIWRLCFICKFSITLLLSKVLDRHILISSFWFQLLDVRIFYQVLCMRDLGAALLSLCLFQTKYAHNAQNADQILSLLASYIEVTMSNMNCASPLRSKLTVVIYTCECSFDIRNIG